MKITLYKNSGIKNWYIAVGRVNGRLRCGYGNSAYKAMKDALTH